MDRHCTFLIWAVVLIIALAELALETSLDLGADANAVPHFHCADFWADLDSLPDDFVTDAQREGGFAPATSDGVDIRSEEAGQRYSWGKRLKGEEREVGRITRRHRSIRWRCRCRCLRRA